MTSSISGIGGRSYYKDGNGINGGITVYGGDHPYACRCFTCGSDRFDMRSLLKDLRPDVDFSYELEIAGTKKTSISVKTKGDQVNITWTSRLGKAELKSFPLNRDFYDLEKLSVTYEDGLLSVFCPVKREIPPEPPQEPEIDIEIK
jgi:hypothetical protein